MIEEFCDWLSATSLSVAFQTASWFVPSVQTVHIIAIAVLLVYVYLIAFRLVGLKQGAHGLAYATAKGMPWIWTALAVLLISGTLLTITEPARELLNWVFRTKMIMVLLLAAIMFVVQRRTRHNADYWTQSPGRRYAARGLGLVAFAIGAAIITAGRWIAYV